jgi:hypothetical protein
MGLGPFIQLAPMGGGAGWQVIVLGNNLTGASLVTFNGAPATFTVTSATEILATVPAGATTGPVQVTTSGGSTLTSNMPFVVVPTQTITFTTAAPATAVYDTSFTVAASASSGLPVTFTSAGACTNSGSTYTMNAGTGTCSVIANQVGNAQYLPAPQVTQSTAAVLASQSITFTVNAPASAVYNSSFTVAATASSGLAVAYSSAGACTNSGATYTMTASTGSCSVIANQAGNGNYSAAPQVTQSTAATVASQSITFTTSAPASAGYHSSFTVVASASSGLPVVYTSSGACTNSSSTYTVRAISGTCSVIANQPGNAGYSAAPQVTQSTTATKGTPTVSFTGAPATADDGTVFTVFATTNDGTSVTIKSAGACSISGTTVTITAKAGRCTLTARWPATKDYLAATATQKTVVGHF